MAGRIRTSRARCSAAAATEPPATAARGRTLVVIDHERLQSAAWAEFHTARKQLDKATRDLHRHEEIDQPAYEAWLHRTFPILVTTLRELGEEVAAKTRKVNNVQAKAAHTGGSFKRLWREQKEREANPAAFKRKPDSDDEPRGFESDGDDDSEAFERKRTPRPTPVARDIYRRLVQQLHPDRGGAWTAARQHLWHEVQQAWAAADADWLARLEIDWESAHEVVGPRSPLSRLRRAIEELHAARRDTERKLREYRGSPQWRFTRTEKNRPLLHRRTEINFAHDLKFLRRQLAYLNATIAAWEEDWTRAETHPKTRRRRRAAY